MVNESLLESQNGARARALCCIARAGGPLCQLEPAEVTEMSYRVGP